MNARGQRRKPRLHKEESFANQVGESVTRFTIESVGAGDSRQPRHFDNANEKGRMSGKSGKRVAEAKRTIVADSRDFILVASFPFFRRS
jgi:hypothetical protein